MVAGSTAPIRLPGYEVVRLIGRGGMGEVYEAIRVGPAGFRKSIAVKQLPSEKSIDGASVQRFLQEARISAQLDHPNIVRIHDLLVQDGYFLVMELLRGWNLSEAIKPHSRTELLSWRAALEIAEQSLAGLAYAHALTDDAGRSLGLVHRDLTPRNLFLTESGVVKILDFGLAKLVNALTPGLTEAGHLHGTLAFLAPEQARAEGSDPRSDLYQLGGVVYWLLSGRAPNGSGSAGEILARAAHSRPPPLAELRPELPDAVLALVARAMEHAPADRFSDAAEMRSQVQAALRSAGELAGLGDLIAELPPVPRPEPISHDAPPIGTGELSATLLRGEASPTKLVRSRKTAPERSRALPWAAVLSASIAAMLGYLAAELRRETPAAIVEVPAPPSAQAPVYRRMTFRPGFVIGARFAPDGETIVYSASFSGAPMETVQKSIDSPEVRALGLKGSEIVGLAGDGRIALLNDAAFSYAFVRKGTLAETSLSGATPRELMVDAQDAEWTPDRELAILRWHGSRTTLELPPGTVLEDAGESRWFSELRISRDGRWIALVEHPVRYDDRGRVVVFDRESKKLKPLTEEWLSVRTLAWGPNDREIWFSGTNKGASRALHAVTLDGEVRAIEEVPGTLALMDVFPDGRALVSHEFQSARIHTKTGGEKERDLSWFDFDAVFDISADGSKVVFVEGGSDAGGATYGAYLRKTDGSPAILLAPGIPWAIAPDGTRALVTPKDRDRIHIIPTGPGEHRSLATRTGTIGGAAWFADDRRVLFATADRGGDRFFLLDTDSLETTALPHRGLHLLLGNPVSPDGTRFAALEVESGRLMLASFDSDRTVPIESALTGEHVLRWTPDGKSVLVARLGDAPLVVTRIDLAAGKRTAWRTFMPADPTGVIAVVSAAISPDLDAYAYTASRVYSTLFVVENLR